MIYDIAGLKVEIKNEKGRTAKQAIPYLAKNQDEKNIDITIDVNENRVKAAMAEHPELVQDDWEYMLTGSDFYTDLINYNGILLHSSCVVVDDYFLPTAVRVNQLIPSFGLNISATGHIF